MNSVEFHPKISFIIIHSLHLLGFPEKNEFLTDFIFKNDVTVGLRATQCDVFSPISKFFREIKIEIF